MAKRRSGSTSGVRGSTGRAAAPIGSSLTDERSGSNRTAKIMQGRGTYAPGYRRITNKTNRVVQPKIIKQVDPQTGKGSTRVGAGGRYANMNDRTLNVPILRVAKSGPQNTGGGPKGASRVVRPAKTAVRIGSGGRTHLRNI